jgi:hypothetical protein
MAKKDEEKATLTGGEQPSPQELEKNVKNLVQAEKKAAEARDLLQGPLRSAAEAVRQRLEDERSSLQRQQAAAVSFADVDDLMRAAEEQRDERDKADAERDEALTVGGLEQPEGTGAAAVTATEPDAEPVPAARAGEPAPVVGG